MSTGPLNSAKPTTAIPVGGVYNATTPAPADQQAVALQVDNEGNLLVNVAVGGGGAGGTVKIEDTSGNALNSNGTGALNVAVVSGGGSNPSVGTTGAVAPTSATEVGIIDGTGKLQGASSTNPVPITGTVNTNADATIGGTSAPSKEFLVAGKTNDGTPQYQPIPEGSGGRSVIVEGVAGGTAVPISGSVSVTGNPAVVGTKTNNNAVPGATNVGTLPAIANAATQSWTEGDQVGLSVDLSGALRDNIAEWGGTAVTAPPASGVPAVGTEVAPVTRPIQRKFGQVLASSLGGSATFTSSFFDSDSTGAMAIAIRCFPTQNLVSGSIQFTDDTSQGNVSSYSLPINGSSPFQAVFPCTGRFWRVVLTNSSTIQGAAFQLTSCELPFVPNVGQNGMFPAVGGSSSTGLGSNPFIGIVGNSAFFADGGGAGNFLPGAAGSATTGVAVNAAVTSSPSSGANVVAIRTPNVFKTAVASASGNTALWTPAAGKKFRLMRLIVMMTDNAAITSAVIETISLLDGAAATNIVFDVFTPSTAFNSGLTGFNSGWIDLGNGILSAAANNVLNINLLTALNSGQVRVICCGTEE